MLYNLKRDSSINGHISYSVVGTAVMWGWEESFE